VPGKYHHDVACAGREGIKDQPANGENMTQLTAAEKRVIVLVSRAKTNKEIAAVLGISPATVKRHLENILRKLQLKNRVAAAIYALRNIGCPRGPHPG